MASPEINLKLTLLSQELAETGYFICDDLLERNEVVRLINTFNTKKTELKPASIGAGLKKVVSPKLRSDKILWLDEDDLELKSYFSLITNIAKILKSELFLPIRQTETQMAIYEKDQFYAKHKDRHTHQGHRWVTAVYYLNDHWNLQDGGELKIYSKSDLETSKVIEPISNRLVVFFSDLEHEVQITNAPRKSFTTWFRDDIR